MKNLLHLFFTSFFLFPYYQAWADSTPEDMVLIQKGCFMMGTHKIHDYLSFDPNIRERPNDRERPVPLELNRPTLDNMEIKRKK
jgi:hypothetical protein